MMSLQLWVKVSPITSLVQHAVALAAVRAIRTLPGYQSLDIRIKWPNDVYYGRAMKIGGVITTATIQSEQVIVNIGLGLNISNSEPTTCVNDIIARHNFAAQASLPPMSVEKFLARFCNELEVLLASMQYDADGLNFFFEQYYLYWLHKDEEVQVQQANSTEPVCGTVCGLDPSGYLKVKTASGELTVHPGNNTFDMMRGLIAPKA